MRHVRWCNWANDGQSLQMIEMEDTKWFIYKLSDRKILVPMIWLHGYVCSRLSITSLFLGVRLIIYHTYSSCEVSKPRSKEPKAAARVRFFFSTPLCMFKAIYTCVRIYFYVIFWYLFFFSIYHAISWQWFYYISQVFTLSQCDGNGPFLSQPIVI